MKSVGDWLVQALKVIQKNYEPMGDVRGLGLFIGIDWVKDRHTKQPDVSGAERIVNRLKDKGFLISNAGAYDNVLKLRPPLVFKHSDAKAFVTTFEETLQEFYG